MTAHACVPDETAAMDQFAFHRVSEAFHHGVVVVIALAAHAGNNARLGQALLISGAGILDAPVGMMYQRIVHRPSDTAAGAAANESCHIEPALQRGHVSDIGHPHGIRLQCGHPMRQAIGFHQPANAPSSAAMSAFMEPARDTGRIVGLATFPMSLSDQRQQHLAQLDDGVIAGHGFYSFKTLPLSSERMPKVFFRMSCCRATWSSSRLSRRFSSSSCWKKRWPGSVTGNAANSFFHRCRLWSVTPSSTAIWRAELLAKSHNSTALCLKFPSYHLCLRGAWFSMFMVFDISSHYHPTSVHQTEARP